MSASQSNPLSRMWRTAWVFATAVAVAVSALAATPFTGEAWAAQTIGTVTKKRMDVYGTPPDESRGRVFPNDTVYYGETLETSGGAAVMVRFEDETELLLGERAKLVIDDFVYDPATKQGRAVYEFSVGTLRFVSGNMVEDEISILTPNANIGIRGSEAIIFVTPEGDTFVNVREGRFSVRSRDRPDVPAVTVEKDQNVSLAGTADFSPVGQGIKVPDYTHDPEAKVPDFSDDLYDLKEGGNFDKASEGFSGGAAGGSSGDSDGGHDHH